MQKSTAVHKITGGETQSRGKGKVPLILLVMFLAGTLVVVLGGIYSPGYKIAPALIWAFGFCVGGMLLGFLFAIPRTLPAGVTIAPALEKENRGRDGSSDSVNGLGYANGHTHSEINSNLVEVSDWLTKIIVGVGLIELKSLPARAERVAAFIAPSLELSREAAATPIAGGIMFFFSILGFLNGYLLTRIYLAVIIKWADNQVKIQNDPIRLRSGKEIEVTELTRLQQDTLTDLQETVAQLVLPNPHNAEAALPLPQGEGAARERRGRVLWVDDNPGNNTLLVEQLSKEGTIVEQVLTTKQALDSLSRNQYDVVVTDMARFEEKRDVQDAGVQLIKEVRKINPELQVIVYCSRRMVNLYGEAAQVAGARLVTMSGTRLIAVLNRILTAASKQGTGD